MWAAVNGFGVSPFDFSKASRFTDSDIKNRLVVARSALPFFFIRPRDSTR